jgi:hypothetical protein
MWVTLTKCFVGILIYRYSDISPLAVETWYNQGKQTRLADHRDHLGIGSSTGPLHDHRCLPVPFFFRKCIFPRLASVQLFTGPYNQQKQEHANVVLFFIIMTGKLYTLGTLRTLNSRINLRERLKSHELGRTSLSEWQWEKGTTSAAVVPELAGEVSQSFYAA